MVDKGFTPRGFRGVEAAQLRHYCAAGRRRILAIHLVKTRGASGRTRVKQEKMNHRSHTFWVFIYPTVALESQLFEV